METVHLKWKVCGMKYTQNILEVAELYPDFMGFIFYPKSSRYVDKQTLNLVINKKIKKVGIFVDDSLENIEHLYKSFPLDLVQLHGNESLEYVKFLKLKNIPVIKVIKIADSLPLDTIIEFEKYVDYFLFDTFTPQHGGSGKKFDWNILNRYSSDVPFFLSGGIDLEDINVIKKIKIPQLFAVDVNSKFENEPALKNVDKLSLLKQLINE